MKTGQRWSSWKLFAAGPILASAIVIAASGCAKDRVLIEKNLLAQSADGIEVAKSYRVACPDVIELDIAQRPEFAGRYEITSEGRINLGEYGNLRVQGRTPVEIIKLVAGETGVSETSMRIRISEFRSQHVLLIGEVNGQQRSVPYCGPETVLELLQRAGGITRGAAPDDVYVIRPHVGDNQRPEIFHVDLKACVLDHDHRTNLRILPFDQVFVGETRRAKISKAVPPWVRMIYSKTTTDEHR